jgi:hypothetical protein
MFYGTKEDLLPLLESVEREFSLKYTRFGTIPTNQPETVFQAKELPNLGIASHESSVACRKFLVSSKGATIRPRALSNFEGKPRFAFDQLHNPETVTLNPGGWWKSDILLLGVVSTASEHPASLSLMKLYASGLRKQFAKIHEFYVGIEAQYSLKQGKRLTAAAQSPAEFDLSFQ